MKERPIIFTGEMVRAILAGRKTETRRVAESIGQSWSIVGGGRAWADLDFRSPKVFADKGPSPAGNPGPYLHVPWRDDTTQRVYPRIQVGDRLWVREAFWHDEPFHAECLASVDYVADHEPGWHPYPQQDGVFSNFVKRSPMHMWKWAARLWLEVVEVRVERVQSMSNYSWVADFCPTLGDQQRALESFVGEQFQKEHSKKLWDRLNAKRGFGWDANPWVWVIRFKVASKPNAKEGKA